MAILKKKLSFVYEKAEQEIEAQILDGRLKAGDCKEDLSALTDRLLAWCREILTAWGE